MLLIVLAERTVGVTSRWQEHKIGGEVGDRKVETLGWSLQAGDINNGVTEMRESSVCGNTFYVVYLLHCWAAGLSLTHIYVTVPYYNERSNFNGHLALFQTAFVIREAQGRKQAISTTQT